MTIDTTNDRDAATHIWLRRALELLEQIEVAATVPGGDADRPLHELMLDAGAHAEAGDEAGASWTLCDLLEMVGDLDKPPHLAAPLYIVLRHLLDQAILVRRQHNWFNGVSDLSADISTWLYSRGAPDPEGSPEELIAQVDALLAAPAAEQDAAIAPHVVAVRKLLADGAEPGLIEFANEHLGEALRAAVQQDTGR